MLHKKVKRKLKKAIGFFILLTCLVVLASMIRYLLTGSSKNTESSYNINTETAGPILSIEDNFISPANNCQFNASVWLGVFDGQLLYLPNSRTNVLRSMGDAGEEILLSDKKAVSVLGYDGRTLYYRLDEYEPGQALITTLYCCDLSTREITELKKYSGADEGLIPAMCVFQGDGIAHFKHLCHEGYLTVEDHEVVNENNTSKEYQIQLGDWLYFLDEQSAVEHVYRQGKSGEVEEVVLAGALRRSLIPIDNGILVHNERTHDLLYLIDEGGHVTELFQIECEMSISSLTVNACDVFLSVRRLKMGGPFGAGSTIRYSDDTLSGTYRISLADYAAQKISDKVYDGMYIFDDTGIYACDSSGNIYKLDFDGNVIDILMEVQGTR